MEEKDKRKEKQQQQESEGMRKKASRLGGGWTWLQASPGLLRPVACQASCPAFGPAFCPCAGAGLSGPSSGWGFSLQQEHRVSFVRPVGPWDVPQSCVSPQVRTASGGQGEGLPEWPLPAFKEGIWGEWLWVPIPSLCRPDVCLSTHPPTHLPIHPPIQLADKC